jgi:hypothetical protein
VSGDIAAFLLARADDLAVHPPEHYAPFEREWEWCPVAMTQAIERGAEQPDRFGDLLTFGTDCTCGHDVALRRHTWQIEALRGIVHDFQLREEQGRQRGGEVFGYHATGMLIAMRRLATIYADRDDYDPAWQMA